MKKTKNKENLNNEKNSNDLKDTKKYVFSWFALIFWAIVAILAVVFGSFVIVDWVNILKDENSSSVETFFKALWAFLEVLLFILIGILSSSKMIKYSFLINTYRNKIKNKKDIKNEFENDEDENKELEEISDSKKDKNNKNSKIEKKENNLKEEENNSSFGDETAEKKFQKNLSE